LEIWPNTLRKLRRDQIPVLVINGRLSETSYRRYRRIDWVLRPLWRSLSFVAAQSETYRQRFVDLGVAPARCATTGSIKFDAAQFDRQNPTTDGFRRWAGLQSTDVVWLAGSTSAPEEGIVLATYTALKAECPHLRLILVPRHRERFAEVAALCRASGHRFWQRSHIVDHSGGATPPSACESVPRFAADAAPQERAWDILLVDTIGELANWWGVADLGFVGGSMGSRGGQSMIEPAGFGVAIAFGPQTSNFRDVVNLLLDNQAAVVVRDQAQLTRFVHRCYHDRDYRWQMGVQAQQVSRQQQGATARTIQSLRPFLQRSGD
jgi:3-deoxy-D-manno-octulosonic-acid transferase